MAEQRTMDNQITQGVIWKQLLAFFFPILLGTFFQQLYNTADAVVVGRYVGKEALAAVGGTTGTLINLFVNLFVGVASGTTVAIAQHYGAKQFDDVRKTVHTSMAMGIIGGACMTVIGFFAAPYALQAMGTPADIMPHAMTYIRIYFFGMIPSFLYNIGAGVLRAVGDTKRPLFFLIAACLTNIVLDLILVMGMGLGVLGVAIATVTSQLLSCVLVLMTLAGSNTSYRLYWEEIRIHQESLQKVLKVGIPAGLQGNMYTISNIIIQSCINSFGTNTVAAWTAFGKIDGLFWMIMGAFGISITTFVGQNFGAQQYRRMRESVRVCLGLALLVSVICTTTLLAFSDQVFLLFTDDPDVIEIGLVILHWTVPFYCTYICVEILSGAIRGTGDSLIPMLLTCGGICALRIAWVFLALPLHRDIVTVTIGYPITWLTTSILFIIYYLNGGWLRRRIEKMGFAPEEKTKKAHKTVQA